jgi:hypothetical protein
MAPADNQVRVVNSGRAMTLERLPNHTDSGGVCPKAAAGGYCNIVFTAMRDRLRPLTSRNNGNSRQEAASAAQHSSSKQPIFSDWGWFA